MEAWRLGGFETLRLGGLEACCPGFHQALLSAPAIFEFMVASIMFLTMCAPGLSCSEGGDLPPLHSRGNAAQFFAALEERGWAGSSLGSSLGSLLGSRWLLFFPHFLQILGVRLLLKVDFFNNFWSNFTPRICSKMVPKLVDAG